jgi:hypothetical protein
MEKGIKPELRKWRAAIVILNNDEAARLLSATEWQANEGITNQA